MAKKFSKSLQKKIRQWQDDRNDIPEFFKTAWVYFTFLNGDRVDNITHTQVIAVIGLYGNVGATLDQLTKHLLPDNENTLQKILLDLQKRGFIEKTIFSRFSIQRGSVGSEPYKTPTVLIVNRELAILDRELSFSKKKKDSRNKSSGLAQFHSEIQGQKKSRTKKRQKTKRYLSQNPSERNEIQDWRTKQELNEWTALDWIGYWIFKYLDSYKIEDPTFVGNSPSAKNGKYKKWGFAILNIVRHDSGLGSPEETKKYIDWLFADFHKANDWFEGTVEIATATKLDGILLKCYRKSKADRPKKVKYVEKRHRWGIERVPVSV